MNGVLWITTSEITVRKLISSYLNYCSNAFTNHCRCCCCCFSNTMKVSPERDKRNTHREREREAERDHYEIRVRIVISIGHFYEIRKLLDSCCTSNIGTSKRRLHIVV